MKFEFELYQNQFKQPLHTSHGVWQIREGIIISLIDKAGVTCQGEIAPLPWFGSETIAQALDFCQQLRGEISQSEIRQISDRLPCCQFALESAYTKLFQPLSVNLDRLNFSYLLPAGAKALTAWQDINPDCLTPTFKWKIGVLPLSDEIAILQQLATLIPPEAKLRLDANGGLNLAQARQLLRACDRLSKIEFVEQPLSTNHLDEMLQLSQEYSTLLALDESVASLKQLQEVARQEWQGVYVIKAAIMGFPSKLTQFCRDRSLDIVFSSVLETDVARQTVLNLSQKLSHPRALGFGVQHLYRCK